MPALLCLFLSLSTEESQQKVEQSPQPTGARRERFLVLTQLHKTIYRFLCFRRNTRKELILTVFIVTQVKHKARVRAPTINMNTSL